MPARGYEFFSSRVQLDISLVPSESYLAFQSAFCVKNNINMLNSAKMPGYGHGNRFCETIVSGVVFRQQVKHKHRYDLQSRTVRGLLLRENLRLPLQGPTSYTFGH